jgi:hypothetical protein
MYRNYILPTFITLALELTELLAFGLYRQHFPKAGRVWNAWRLNSIQDLH